MEKKACACVAGNVARNKANGNAAESDTNKRFTNADVTAMRMRPEEALRGSTEPDASVGEIVRHMFASEGCLLAEAALGDFADDLLVALAASDTMGHIEFHDALWRIARRAQAVGSLVSIAQQPRTSASS